ncbi:DUF1289 domain-containing protein [Brachymonas denitrificans]|uniref:DUF1289 domain-containing protein n=1 Tax=Brachymonas denitrificans TaxID=28220 RepID=UPI002AFE82A8|nr:DUF1289 domain-containing protein [Brachymonas denitrificans]
MTASTRSTEKEAQALAARVACALAMPQCPSPCINVCQIDPASGLCRGCWRTLDEIAHWAVLDEEEKQAIWRALPARSQTIVPR